MSSASHPLFARIPPEEARHIDEYESQLVRFLDGSMSEKVFLEFRLRHGVYGQRQAGTQMQRIKIPMGHLTLEQMETLADVAEEYSDSISHVTTRQDIQLHFVKITDSPALMRRLAVAGITTKEACGNVVRNVTACPLSGVCPTEPFDVTPHAHAMALFLLKHPDAQNFGRKFKISYSGCEGEACGLAGIHDIGAVAAVREVEGQRQEGFRVYVGGGLGAVPHAAQLLSDFLLPEEMLPMAQAIARIFTRLGEKKQRARARMKFLVAKLGIEEFRKLVEEEVARLPEDSLRDGIYSKAIATVEKPLHAPAPLEESADTSPAFRFWRSKNVRPQKTESLSVVTVFLPLGDLTSHQFRGLAALAREYVGDAVRLTVPQNIVLRNVSNADLPAIHQGLVELKLGLPLADTIADMTACPGTDTCKLGIAASRGLAAVMHEEFLKQLEEEQAQGGDGSKTLRDDIVVKMSGCFNSCSQHHIANIGFFGTSKRKSGKVLPLFQVILGGEMRGNASAYGLPVTKVPAHQAPEVVRRLSALYDGEKQDGEDFNATMARLGKKDIADRLADLAELGDEPAFFHDNRQPWEYVKDVGQGECAGEMVDQAEFLLEDAERMIFDASFELEQSNWQTVASHSAEAMKKAADALLSTHGLLLSDNYDTASKFRELYVDQPNFHPGVADYYKKIHEEGNENISPDRCRQRLEEANLFVEEAHVIYSRMAGAQTK